MRRILMTILGLLVLAAMSPRSTPAAEPPIAPNAFACDLYHQLSAADGNLFFSPLSISTALAMTWAGAGGRTAAEMAAVLHFTGPALPVHAANEAMLGSLATGESDSWKLAIANRLWPARGLELRPAFLELTEKYYHARPQVLDFAGATEEARRAINRWAEDNTAGMIKELLQQGDLDSLVRLVLTNAIYFQADWASAFDAAQTGVGSFHPADGVVLQVPFMTQTGTFPYRRIDGVQVLQLPYAGSSLAFVAILPDEPDGLARVEAELDFARLDRWLKDLEEQELSVQLPRFDLTWRNELREPLQNLGMKLAFSGAADFSGMTSAGVSIDQVIHQARIKVTEQGTEAAAATAVILRENMQMMFRADHPFLFLVRDTRTGDIVFMGRLSEPQGGAGG